jgi:predicted Zn-dependent protease
MRSSRLIIALILVLIGVVTYLGQRSYNPVTGETQHVSLTKDQEIALGLESAPQMKAEYGGATQDRAAQARVERVGNRLVSRSPAKDSGYRFQFTVLDDNRTVNAFALPGGPVFITEALLRRLSTDGELAGVLGHEMGHVLARHGAEHLASQQLTQALGGAAVIATYDPNNPQRSAQTAAVAQAIGSLVNMRYGRGDELQSDELGVRFMADAGYDPRSMVRVMEILQQANRGGHPPEFFSTHPNSEHRISTIEAAIKQRFPQGVPAGLEK